MCQLPLVLYYTRIYRISLTPTSSNLTSWLFLPVENQSISDRNPYRNPFLWWKFLGSGWPGQSRDSRSASRFLLEEDDLLFLINAPLYHAACPTPVMKSHSGTTKSAISLSLSLSVHLTAILSGCFPSLYQIVDLAVRAVVVILWPRYPLPRLCVITVYVGRKYSCHHYFRSPSLYRLVFAAANRFLF